MANGAKLIGSAQHRRGGAILQHGSIRLEPDAALFNQVFGGESLNSFQLPIAQRGEALIQMVSEALIAAAVSCFGIVLDVQPLSPSEWEAILRQPGLEIKPRRLLDGCFSDRL